MRIPSLSRGDDEFDLRRYLGDDYATGPTRVPQMTVRVTPRGPGGEPLLGAIVNGTEEFDGTPVELSMSADDESLSVHVTHFGRKVFDESVPADEMENVGSRRRAVDISCEKSFYPASFTGAEDAKWVGEEIAVIWEPDRNAQHDAYEVSVAQSKEALFRNDASGSSAGDSSLYSAVSPSGETAGITRRIEDGRHALIGHQPFMDQPVFVACRLAGKTRGEKQVLQVPAYDDAPLPEGTDIGGVQLTPSSVTARDGDLQIFRAEVTGPSNPDPTVTFSATGDAALLAEGPETAVVEITGDGTVTATSAADSTVSAASSVSVATPTSVPAPSGLRAQPVQERGGVLLSWDVPAGDIATRIRPASGPILDTEDNSLFVGEVTSEEEVEVVHLGPGGEKGDVSETVTLQPGSVAQRSVGFLVQALPELVVAPGQTTTLDLSSYVTLAGGPEDGSTQEDLWQSQTWHLHHISSEEGITSVASGSQVQLTGETGLQADSSARDLLLVEIEGSPKDPLWLGIPVARGGEPSATQARSIAGAPAAWASLASGDVRSLVGESPSVYTEPRWEKELSKLAHRIDTSIPESEDGSSELELSYEPSEDMRPAIAAIEGEKGVSVFCLIDDSAPHYGSPKLPGGSAKKVERPDGYVGYTSALLSGSAHPENWRRALTASDRLFDLSVFRPPSEVRYSPPIYFGSTWVDERRFPDDAEIDYGEGHVTYRGGITSPSSSPVEPSIDQFRADGVRGGIDVQWSVSITGTDVSGAVELTAVPSDGAGGFDDSQAFVVAGDGSVRLRGLDDTKTYKIELFSADRKVAPKHPPIGLTLTGWRQTGGSYAYRIESDATLQSLTDGFGTEHTAPDFPLQITASEAASEQVFVVEFSSGETREIREAVQWELPKEPVETTQEVLVGRELPAEEVEAPTFLAATYEGERTYPLPTNIYKPGRLRLEPEGHLPPTMDGEVEDHIDLTFIGPDGEELGRETTIEQPTELRARATITATGGQTPVFYGATVARWDA